jgi:hypothetical protein
MDYDKRVQKLMKRLGEELEFFRIKDPKPSNQHLASAGNALKLLQLDPTNLDSRKKSATIHKQNLIAEVYQQVGRLFLALFIFATNDTDLKNLRTQVVPRLFEWWSSQAVPPGLASVAGLVCSTIERELEKKREQHVLGLGQGINYASVNSGLHRLPAAV